MIAEIGHFALVLALCVALVQAIVPLIGAKRGNMAWMNLSGPAATLQFLFIALAFGALTNAYVTSDFSVMNVAQNSHTDKPMLYKVAGVWGNHEGSLLLWITILSLFGFAVTLFGRNLPPGLKSRALAVQSMIAVGFLAFILLTSNPFARLEPPPVNGQGLNPMLQDPGLAFHPPFLYLGYVGFSMAFSFAIAALLEGRVDAAWARWVRPWTLAAWVFLTCGIVLGSWWAYYTLGWGGWWYWDPVENASFMPWLAGTALLHSAIVVEKRDALKSWTILLAIVTFGLSLLGTFLVRSGVLTSVHAFATDPARGVFILLLLCGAVGGSLALYAARAPSMKMGGLFSPISREGALLLNNVLMATGAATVLLGTLYPLIADALNLGKVSVGPPFFNAVFLPLMAPMVLVMATAPMMNWKRGDLAGVLGRLKFIGALALGVAMLVWFLQGGSAGPWWTAAGFALAVWLGLGTLWDLAERIGLFARPSQALARAAKLPNSAWGMVLAHFGLAVFIVGLTASSAWTTERIQTQKLGETVIVAGYGITLKSVEEVPGPNYTASRATFEISKGGEVIGLMAPEKRMYRQPPRPTTTAAIRSGFTGDLYVVIGDPDPNKGGWVTRLYFNPCIPWLWAGGLLLVVGGLISLADRRHRIGAPARAAQSAAKA
ncbi:Cytochrome c heme lyase subunit CcmF [Paramagnetospirillum magnetotacticum MS-1]|uniref:Cytochrome c heme lyase subunit CcmF n=1 Tax=Paramagnetospirillum magnetotacticum MS-1 TaxID=272627 RepID=A0A0C2YEN5_PARME|nr:heme lyase CcmF/NrfE family subunit [Paramagnetospirillum magnetotacticum]KIL98159.1 Cytochrome c heme lyase subunit CcmF [Paramagnetospirillum magnetotacticum MS-1]